MKTRHTPALEHWDLGEVTAHYLNGSFSAVLPQDLPGPEGHFLLVVHLKGTLQISGTPAFEARQANLLFKNVPEYSLETGTDAVQTLLLYYSPAFVEGFAPKGEGRWSGRLATQHLDVDLAMHNTVQVMLACPFEGEIRRVFLLGKSLELLALFFEAHDRSQRTRFVHCKTEYDRERLLFAREYLLQRFDLPPTLDELARIAGLNVFKLKNGFKELFGKPVFAWLNDYKMDLAQRELAQQIKSASQLAFDLGYSSLSHFSRAFRRHFGYPPGRLRK